MATEFPRLVQCEGVWLAFSGCNEVVALGVCYEDVLNESLCK